MGQNGVKRQICTVFRHSKLWWGGNREGEGGGEGGRGGEGGEGGEGGRGGGGAGGRRLGGADSWMLVDVKTCRRVNPKPPFLCKNQLPTTQE